MQENGLFMIENVDNVYWKNFYPIINHKLV